MTIQVGDKIPSVLLQEKTADGVQPVKTDDLFKGKRVVLFAVPGAFTPTCSAKHLPGFVQNADQLKKKGIDAVACVAVNDAFVMDAWGKEHGAPGKVRMIGDGNADLTKALGVDRDASANGMGVRSKRYSMIVENGVVKVFNLEPTGEYGASMPSALKISTDEAETPRITSACGLAFSASTLAVITPVESRTNFRSMLGLVFWNDSV